MFLLWVACGGDEPAPIEAPAPAAHVELEPFRGRWIAAQKEPDGTWAVCRPPSSVEVRGDADLGWDLVRSVADDLQILPIRSAGPSADGVRFELDGSPPAELRWEEKGKVATFPGVAGAQTYLAPGTGEGLRTVSCRAPSP